MNMTSTRSERLSTSIAALDPPNARQVHTCTQIRSTTIFSKFQVPTLCVLVLLVSASAQGSSISVSVDLGEGLVYFLVILFFGLNFGTPAVRWLYANYLSKWVEKATKEMSKAQKRFTERMSDASRRVTQSIRVENK